MMLGLMIALCCGMVRGQLCAWCSVGAAVSSSGVMWHSTDRSRQTGYKGCAASSCVPVQQAEWPPGLATSDLCFLTRVPCSTWRRMLRTWCTHWRLNSGMVAVGGDGGSLAAQIRVALWPAWGWVSLAGRLGYADQDSRLPVFMVFKWWYGTGRIQLQHFFWD